jgi:hypothetical protein
MAGRVRLTEAQKVTLRILNRDGPQNYEREKPAHNKLIALGFAETALSGGGSAPARVDIRITPEGREYVHGAHK